MKEDSDNTEREFKFESPKDADDEVVLSQLRPLMPRAWRLVKWPPRTVLDIYFDGVGLPLFRSGATFRLRKRRVNIGWTANFKPASEPNLDYMERREVRTSVSIEEALRFRTKKGIPGLAAMLGGAALRSAVDIQSCMDRITEFMPVVQLVSCRRCYTLRPGDLEDRASNFLNAIFEEVTAIDLRKVDAAALIRSGFLDYSQPIPSAKFTIAELEVDGREDDLEKESLEMMRTLAQRLVGSGLKQVTISKYRQAIGYLEMTPTASNSRVSKLAANLLDVNAKIRAM